MKGQPTRHVLGIDPSTRSVAFAVLEGSDFLVDCGTKTTRKADSARALEVIGELIEKFQPRTIANRGLQVQRFAEAQAGPEAAG
jgi:Holliday junction resolvasome RuvABC endonuclease subunit